ncbi:hypothetical protein PRZ48_005234 [Zasmidium cellare]|uniref:Uncharacterized protein n=1 Tax=Zasmidium cellare TaxID=395010 RepID=A0ABR0ET16_ZASCE|nr:hypothetical protein PRZ48_005234 [Zasmidium cellare]
MDSPGGGGVPGAAPHRQNALLLMVEKEHEEMKKKLDEQGGSTASMGSSASAHFQENFYKLGQKDMGAKLNATPGMINQDDFSSSKISGMLWQKYADLAHLQIEVNLVSRRSPANEAATGPNQTAYGHEKPFCACPENLLCRSGCAFEAGTCECKYRRMESEAMGASGKMPTDYFNQAICSPEQPQSQPAGHLGNRPATSSAPAITGQTKHYSRYFKELIDGPAFNDFIRLPGEDSFLFSTQRQLDLLTRFLCDQCFGLHMGWRANGSSTALPLTTTSRWTDLRRAAPYQRCNNTFQRMRAFRRT